MEKCKQVKGRGSISRFGERILCAMRREEAVASRCGKIVRIGRLTAPTSVIEELARHQLVRIGADGNAALTDVGEKFLGRRRARTERIRSAPSARIEPGPFAQQHKEIATIEVELDGRLHKATRNIAEGPLGWLHRRRDAKGRPLISADQMEAGEQLRRDFEAAALRPKVTGSYDGIPRDRRRNVKPANLTPTDRALNARKRLNAALTEVGPGLADVLYRVCCHLEGIGEVERHMGWPQRSGKVILSLALDRLIDHYDGDK